MSDETERHRQDNRSPALHFEMVRRKPAASLADIVTDICGYRETLPGHFRVVEYASLTVPLVISFAEAFAIGLGRSPGDNDRYASFASGLYAGPVMIESFGGSCCVQVNFTPLGARRFFGLPMSELKDRMVGLDDALGFEGIALRERLGDAPDWDTRFAIAEGFVTSRLAEANELSPEVAWAYGAVIASGGRHPDFGACRRDRLEPQASGGKIHRRDRHRAKDIVAHRALQPGNFAIEAARGRLGRHRRRLRLCRPGASGARVSSARRRNADRARRTGLAAPAAAGNISSRRRNAFA